MNPAEWLRSVSRYAGDDAELALEAAGALAQFARRPAGLVVACRRLLAHRPADGPLWWLCARLLVATDPETAATEAADLLRTDATDRRLADALPILDPDERLAVVGTSAAVRRALDQRPDLALPEGPDRPVPLVLVPARALDAQRAVVPPGVDALDDQRTRRWLVSGVGRELPRPLLDALVRAVGDTCEVVPVERFDRIVGPLGTQDPADVARRPDCPVAPELLRPLD